MIFDTVLSELLYFLTLGVATFFGGLVGTRVFIGIMEKNEILARPNERSMHSRPIPTGAGFIIVLITVLVYLATGNSTELTNHWLVPLLTFLLALMSWLDDKNELLPALRFGMHIAAVTIVLSLLADSRPILWKTWPLWMDRVFAGLCWLWFLNLFNFMDGIDGIAGIEIITISLGLLAIGIVNSLPLPMNEVLVTLVGVTLGFLWLNWHPAKIYLGDTGSISLGFLLGFLLIRLAQQGYLAAALLIPAYPIADASYTLLRRLIQGEPVWRAHRSHFYQRATIAVGNPAIIVIRIAIANFVLICAAVLSTSHQIEGLALGLLTVIVLLIHLHLLGQRE